jgi:hypothetical protein
MLTGMTGSFLHMQRPLTSHCHSQSLEQENDGSKTLIYPAGLTKASQA